MKPREKTLICGAIFKKKAQEFSTIHEFIEVGSMVFYHRRSIMKGTSIVHAMLEEYTGPARKTDLQC